MKCQRSNSYLDVRHTSSAKLVTTFKEMVTIFRHPPRKPRLLISMGADNGRELRTRWSGLNSSAS